MKFLLVGCGGYAALYVREIFSPLNVDDHEIEGIVDPYASGFLLLPSPRVNTD